MTNHKPDHNHEPEPFDYDNDLEPAERLIEGIFISLLVLGIVGTLIWWGMLD